VIRFGNVSRFAAAIAVLTSCGVLCCSAAESNKPDAGNLLKPRPMAGQTLSDITYRVIAIHGPGMDDSVVQVPATGTYTFLPSGPADSIKWTVNVRMDGRIVMKDAAGEYRDNGTTMCFDGKCSFTTDASGPFFNPTFWGRPEGELKPGQSWTVTLKQPWELGPPGQQTITVLSVDGRNGMVVLKREGEGMGPFEGGSDSTLIKKDGKQFKVAVKYGKAHWEGQAVFQHGVVVSDELLCITPVELSSADVGTILAQERQYMSVLEHPGTILD
jgi:hypothetical protein